MIALNNTTGTPLMGWFGYNIGKVVHRVSNKTIPPRSQLSIGSHTRVYFKADRGEVENLLQKAQPGFQILACRRREFIAEAMLYAGSQACHWRQIISHAQAKVSLFVQKNEHLDPVLKIVEKARAEVSPMTQFTTEVLQSLDNAYEDFIQSRQ